ncbi:hypothetical protein AB0M95_16000 [Sphaerisporangium sp. NPDC051017]|uniref:hypothetical protein n=1 Tax=Sphaerisporangium sp. NPDC051017 TaxID=3154636 RepID=UPI0034248265
MKNLLRLLATPLLAASLVLAAFTVPVHADTADGDAELALQWQDAWDTYKFYDTTPPAPESGRSRATADISIEISAPVKRVFEKYSNFNNHIGMHPFLKRIVTHREWCRHGTRYVNLTAVDEIPYNGAIVLSNAHAQQRIHEEDLYYETDTWSLPGIVTHQKIVFKRLSSGKTKVTEHLVFDADTSLIDLVVTSGVSSHQQTQRGLKTAIERGDI